MTHKLIWIVAILVLASPVFSQVFEAQASPEDVEPYDFIGLGFSLPAVTVNLESGELGFFESVSPVAVLVSPRKFQRVVEIRPGEFERASIWSMQAAIMFSKAEGEDVAFGFMLAPYIARIGPLACGIGVIYQTTDIVELRKDNWSLALPLSYEFTLGGNQ